MQFIMDYSTNNQGQPTVTIHQEMDGQEFEVEASADNYIDAVMDAVQAYYDMIETMKVNEEAEPKSEVEVLQDKIKDLEQQLEHCYDELDAISEQRDCYLSIINGIQDQIDRDINRIR